MAKGQTQQASSAAGDLLTQAPAQTTPIIQGLQSSTGNLQKNQGDLYNTLTSGLDQNQKTGGYDPSQLNELRSSTQNNAVTGGYNPDEISSLKSSGGYDPTLLQSIQSGASAGYDPTAASSITGGYSDFANTGGFTPEASTNYINQATSGVKATSDALQQQAKLATQKSGGFGGAGAVAQIARQLGQTQSQATVNAEDSLNTQINANKLAGLGGLNSSQANQAALKQSGAGILNSLAGNQASNKLAATQSEAGNKLAGTNQQLALEGGVAQGATSANSQLNSLYDATSGEITAQGQQVLQALGLNFNTQAQAVNALVALSKNPGTFQTILNGVTQAAGAAAGVAGALP